MLPSSSRSKAKSRPLPRATFEDAPSDDSSSNDERRPMPKMRPLLGPFTVILGGQLIMKRANKRRRTEPSLLERLPLTLQGAIKFRRRPQGPIVRPLTLVSPESSRGQWRRVYFSDSYPKLAFKLGVRDDYYDQEVRAFRDIPFYTTQYVQSFKVWIDLGDWDGTQWLYQCCQLMILVCEKITPMSDIELGELDGGKLVLLMLEALATAALSGWRPTDCGLLNWGMGLRHGEMRPLILDANSWQYADPNAPPQFPPKRFIAGFYATMDALLPDSKKHFKQIPHNNLLNPADIIAEIHALLQQHYPAPLVR